MNRQEFIQKIIELYPDTFRPDRVSHIQAWVEMYENALNKNWDYDKLMRIFAVEYKSTVVPPAPSFFYQFKSTVYVPKPKVVEKVVQTPEEIEACEQAKARFFEKFRKLKEQCSMGEHI